MDDGFKGRDIWAAYLIGLHRGAEAMAAACKDVVERSMPQHGAFTLTDLVAEIRRLEDAA